MYNHIIEKLLNNETVITSFTGNSMFPLVKSKQSVKIEPIKIIDCKKNDIVFCKVKGRFYLHLVKNTDVVKGLLIGNNKGNINGWTKVVYGKVIEFL